MGQITQPEIGHFDILPLLRCQHDPCPIQILLGMPARLVQLLPGNHRMLSSLNPRLRIASTQGIPTTVCNPRRV